MTTMYGETNHKNEYFDTSTTLRGAKIQATKNGSTKIYRRVGYNTHLAACKIDKKWFKV